MTVPLIVGIVVGNSFAIRQSLAVPVVIVSLLVALFSYRNLIFRDIVFYVAIFFLGIVIYNKSSQDLSVPSSDSSIFQAVLMTSPKRHGKVVRCDIIVTTGNMSGKRLQASIMRDTIEKRYLYLKPGVGISVNASISPVKDYRKGNFNYKNYLHSHGVSGTAFIPFNNWIFTKTSLSGLSTLNRLRLKAAKYQCKLGDKYRISGLENEGLAITSAMTLGDKSMLDKAMRDRFSVTGVSHVLAMSGLHLGILYLFLTFAWGRRKRWVAVSLFNILAVWAFVFIAGMPLSLVRSALMLSVFCMLDVIHRNTQPINTLALSALLIIAANPESIFDVGFQMSFMAVLFILAICPKINAMVCNSIVFRYRIVRNLLNFINVSCVAQVAVAPLVAYYFSRFSSYFLLSNFVAIPCTYIIIVCGMLLLAIPFPAVQDILAKAISLTTNFMDKCLTWISSLPGSSIENIRIDRLGVCVIYAVIFFLCYFFLIRKTDAVFSRQHWNIKLAFLHKNNEK